ncbi:MAG: type 1 glutamine amidotransferase [Rhodothermaceae bacterium]|nr:type 1 glutamine amidotransferase [Rhodothermaceae bacterium]
MAPSYDHLRVRLIQIRERPDVLAEEQASFQTRCALRPEQFLLTNALRDDLTASLLDDADAVLIGGAGAYSVTHSYGWTQSLIDLCQACADRQVPLFGSCWGHQFIARAFGGHVVHDMDRAEMGTHEVDLTEAGMADPLFAPFPRRFAAQMGHQDRVAELPDGAVELARNDVAPFQAFRLADAPIYGTQFHSELDHEAERERLYAYRDHYPEMQVDDRFQETLASLRPTPDVDGLLERFLRLFAVEESAQAA